MNNKETIQRMMNEDAKISAPGYQYFGEDAMKIEVDVRIH
jgi:hypothetical protein